MTPDNDRLTDLRAQYEAGTYRPDAESIAAAILYVPPAPHDILLTRQMVGELGQSYPNHTHYSQDAVRDAKRAWDWQKRREYLHTLADCLLDRTVYELGGYAEDEPEPEPINNPVTAGSFDRQQRGEVWTAGKVIFWIFFVGFMLLFATPLVEPIRAFIAGWHP